LSRAKSRWFASKDVLAQNSSAGNVTLRDMFAGPGGSNLGTREKQPALNPGNRKMTFAGEHEKIMDAG